MPLQWFLLVAVALLGACVGSFLNVVIYRLARGLSVCEPARSFCPGCGKTIAGYDNIPLVSYLILRGRCRHCGVAISVQYPLVEALTVLLFLQAYDTFFLSPARPEFTLSLADAPIFLAHLILLAVLIVTSAIDIEGYWIDVTITYMLVSVGVVGHALWTPERSASFPRPWPMTAAAATAGTIGLILTVLVWRTGERAVDDATSDGPESESPSGKRERKGRQDAPGPRLALAWLLVLVIAVWIALVAIDAGRPDDVQAFVVRVSLVLAVCFLALVFVGMAPTESETQIIEAINEERVQARRTAAREVAWLLPAIFLGIQAAVLVCYSSRGGQMWQHALDWAPRGGAWRPLLGLTTALAGFVVAGAIGWGVRIVFTLILGKEAFGLGDVHLMAAAGAVAGWPVVAAGFFLACPLAVLAVVIWLVRKRSRAVWFGPWLSLGVVLAMAAYVPIAQRVTAALEVFAWLAGGSPP